MDSKSKVGWQASTEANASSAPARSSCILRIEFWRDSWIKSSKLTEFRELDQEGTWSSTTWSDEHGTYWSNNVPSPTDTQTSPQLRLSIYSTIVSTSGVTYRSSLQSSRGIAHFPLIRWKQRLLKMKKNQVRGRFFLKKSIRNKRALIAYNLSSQ
jgi:hypothetical protein